MTQEMEPSILEKPATHKKKGQLVALAVVGVIAVIMIIDAVLTVSQQEDDKKEEQVQQQTAQAVAPADRTKSLADFERKFQEESKRVQTTTPAEAPAVQVAPTPATPNASITQGIEQSQRTTEDSALEDRERKQWIAAEDDRARKARMSRFNLNIPASAPSRAAQPVPRIALPAETLPPSMRATAQTAPDLQVGQPSANTGGVPLAGQQLLSTSTVIRAVLDQKVMSDYANGPWRALVVDDVYDVTGQYILMPKGSRIEGKTVRITNVNEPIQARMGLVTRWAILPNGKRISFEKTAQALDAEGISAFKDEVDYHFIAQFLGVTAYAILSSETTRDSTNNNGQTNRTFRGDVSDAVRLQYASLASRYLTLVPTITLNPGLPMRIYIEDDLYITPWAKVDKNLLPVDLP